MDTLTNKKLIIFDLDGTLIDSVPDLALAINNMLKALNFNTFEEKTIRNWIGNGAKTLVERALNHTLQNVDEKTLQKALDIFLQEYEKNLTSKTILFKGVKKTLQKLKDQGYTLAILTNKPHRFVSPILKKFEILELFSIIIGADSLPTKKPNPEPILYICKKLNFKLTNTLMVGDSKNDILCANNAGVASIAVNYGYNYDENISDYNPSIVIDDFTEILNLLTPKIAIVGGGIAGSSVAIYLAELGLDITLFEKKETIIDGPPLCHLHAGGNLYREISDTQCLTLLEESIDFMQLYPQAIEARPTLLITPKSDNQDPKNLIKRLDILKEKYKQILQENKNKKLLGDIESYYKVFNKADVLKLSKLPSPQQPKTADEWLIEASKHIDLEKVKFPFILVQEFGLNIFRLASSGSLMIKNYPNIKLLNNTEITSIQQKDNIFELSYNKSRQNFDYLINAAGFESGIIDDMLNFSRQRYVEFKSAYVTKNEKFNTKQWPEIIFFGQRGTPNGMAQFTPYPDGFFQLHGMTNNITLFNDGLVKSNKLSAIPKLPKHFLDKIYIKWSENELEIRTKNAIKHIGQYIPSYKDAKTTTKPLFGAQQIPGDDADLRAAEVSFENHNYARCEIVKGSSVVNMAKNIALHLFENSYIPKKVKNLQKYKEVENITQKDVTNLAIKIAKNRNYPSQLGKANYPLSSFD